MTCDPTFGAKERSSPRVRQLVLEAVETPRIPERDHDKVPTQAETYSSGFQVHNLDLSTSPSFKISKATPVSWYFAERYPNLRDDPRLQEHLSKTSNEVETNGDIRIKHLLRYLRRAKTRSGA